MTIPAQYNPKDVEDKWYNYWMENNYFHSTPNEKEAYTIVIPPPNVTGILHMGHMLNNTIQDVLIRRARLKGFNACWVPGTDHASIATEAKVVAKLAAQGIDKADLTRDEFLKHAWEWTEEHGGIILDQLKKLGASCDWERTKFTMDKDLNESVTKVFVDLNNKGLIYRGYRMVNWDPEAKTTLSDEEVIYEEKQGKLYYVKYQIEGEDSYITIATTRPETILGDSAICINPNDERFKHLKGKKVIVPIANRVIPVIEDDYVDIEFGTGCLKITPAHDPNDKLIGERHNLEVIDIFNDDATLNSLGLHYQGKDRFVVRKEISKELKDLGILIKTEDHLHKVGTSERTKAVIEPKISAQWFLKMEDLVQPALDAVLQNEEIKLHPKRYTNTYRHWLENIRDWNISRQLWWGHQIPAYFYGQGVNDYVIAETRDEALVMASEKLGKAASEIELVQDPDALDTWFSSWLWPISVFNGINEPDNEEINYYYPTNDLVTGPDIIFFWVARMVFAGYEYRKAPPFKNVYFTGIVRDKQRRKMSKSLGNSPDPIQLMEQYGADGVRVGLLLSSAAGNDLMFDEDLCAQGRNFANKIWNSFRLINGWTIDPEAEVDTAALDAISWYENKFQQVISSIEVSFESYRISEALMSIYKLIWDDFSSWLLEAVKPAYGKGISSEIYDRVNVFFENNLKLLHPFMPFLTEEIWQHMKERSSEEALIISSYPEIKAVDTEVLQKMEYTQELISSIRSIRKDKNIAFKEALELTYIQSEGLEFHDSLVAKMCNVVEINKGDSAVEGAISFRVKSSEFFIPIKDTIDVEKELEKLKSELTYTQGFLKGVDKKLSNERFVNNAPEKVIEMERKKQEDANAKIKTLLASIKALE